MSERSEFDERTDKVLRNDIILDQAMLDLRGMFATLDNTDFGISTHEVEHAVSVIQNMKNRTGALLAEMHPAPKEENHA